MDLTRRAPRRPVPPHLRADTPGVRETLHLPPPAATAAPHPASATAVPGSPHRSRASAAPATAGSDPGRAPASLSTPRRTVLAVGGAAAATVTLAAAALWAGRPGTRAGAGASARQPVPSASFSDVSEDHPAATAMAWADATGVQPAMDGDYRPEDEVTRGAMALALHRFAGAPALDLGTIPVLLTDVPEDPERSAAVQWLHGHGALWGDAELRVHPDQPAQRAWGATLLTDLLVPALSAAGHDASALLEAAPVGPEDAVLTRADLATMLFDVDQALSS